MKNAGRGSAAAQGGVRLGERGPLEASAPALVNSASALRERDLASPVTSPPLQRRLCHLHHCSHGAGASSESENQELDSCP